VPSAPIFSFADLGFMELSNNYNYLGDATLGNTLTYKIQEIPSNNRTTKESLLGSADRISRQFRSESIMARSPVQIENHSGIQN
jgi:hypothetical protein